MDEKWLFYAAFEDRYRGSFEDIKKRVAEYLPYLQLQKSDLALLPALDLGSGRGEWLTLLAEHDVRGTGVDQNLVAVEQARKLGLDVRHGDLFETLKSSEDACYRLVSAFHVVEHLPWEMQLKLFTECRRVIAPDGILIIEWPNTDNISVATQHFWLDPTHVRPLPILLASFMAEYAGFKKIEIKKFRAPIFKAPGKSNKPSKIYRSLFGSLSRPNEFNAPPELQALANSMKSGSDVALICSR